MTGLVLTDEVVRPELNVVLEEQNQRVANNPRRAARRADRGRALSQSSLWPAGDRLAARDREAQPRGRARLLPALLHAQQRRSWWSPATSPPTRSRRSPRRPTARSRRSPRSARACGRRSRRRSRARTVTLADPRVDAAEPAALLSRAVLHHRQGRRGRGARRAGATSSAAAPTAGSTARWWSRSGSRSVPAPGTRARRSMPRGSASTARRKPGVTLRAARRARSTP